MLIKAIRCEVPQHWREPFDKAQRAWHPLRELNGFMYQCGGWVEEDPERAYLFGLWRDTKAHQDFMRSAHDRIYQGTGQQGTYAGIHIDFGETEEEVSRQLPEKQRIVLLRRGPAAERRSNPRILWEAWGDTLILTWPASGKEELRPDAGDEQAAIRLNPPWTVRGSGHGERFGGKHRV
ncbi:MULTISPECIES: DUF4937 domain-containing protein [Paenibacillus]|uniref:DUF4937 domain-containing protein n=1 Tax=Paenibacillus TaxID=44249 RepID=UPI0022B884AA|nr:DUF4937 domain-containing protein [Paenibacillus caseinilyticus]MCZ8521802.1 DUF4937 domain-containing protein [Paenibacillus caseinilyticus]